MGEGDLRDLPAPLGLGDIEGAGHLLRLQRQGALCGHRAKPLRRRLILDHSRGQTDVGG